MPTTRREACCPWESTETLEGTRLLFPPCIVAPRFTDICRAGSLGHIWLLAFSFDAWDGTQSSNIL